MPAHSKFSRSTILAAVDVLEQAIDRDDFDFDRMYAEWGLTFSGLARARLIRSNWANALKKLLLANPGSRTVDGGDLSEAVVSRAIDAGSSRLSYFNHHESAKLRDCLKQDGYIIENGRLVRAIAIPLNFTAIDDEVHTAINRLGFLTTKGHLEQAAKNHSAANWAASNSQLRVAFVSLLDETAHKLDPRGAAAARTEENRRQLLSTLSPPFLLTSLNEWSADGKNFINGVLKRLHPQGAHPGLSDEEDCTFRFHLVLLVSRFLLRRLK